MRAWAPVIALAVSIVSASVGEAGARPRAAFRAARAAWQLCFPGQAAVPSFPEPPVSDNPYNQVTVLRTRAGFHIRDLHVGNGVESGAGGTDIAFEPHGCRALWVDYGSYDGDITVHARVAWVNREAPTSSELRALRAELARPDDPAHGFARAWLGHACPGGPESMWPPHRERLAGIGGPIAPAQPWHRGRPRRGPATFWPVAMLDTIQTGQAAREPDDIERPPPRPGSEMGGVEVPGIGQPVRTYAAAGHAVFEAEIPGRNGGRAIAIHDRENDRHRWVVVTRGCVQGTRVKWVGAIGGRIVGVTRSGHPRYAPGDAILIIDLSSGTAWAVALPDEFTLDRASEGRVRASLSRGSLTLRSGGIERTMKLRPLLVRIPPPP
jgi:hypothetical protein